MDMAGRKLFGDYGASDEMPLPGYAALLAIYAVGFGGLLALASRVGSPRTRSLRLRDLLLVGIATHKLTRTITRDRATAPLRARFTAYKRSLGHGEVEEEARGRGLRRAVGELLTCPFCTGPWIAGALVCGMALAPRPTRLVAGIFASVTVSDFLHQAYEAAAERTKVLALAAASEGAAPSPA
jgi:hypothetical protein